MREINSNQNNLNFPKVEIKKETAQPAEPPKIDVPSEPLSVADNLSLTPGAVIGRSQVNNADNTEADMKSMLDNPKAVENAVNFFDTAYEQLKKNGSENPYEKAAALTNAFKEEFSN